MGASASPLTILLVHAEPINLERASGVADSDSPGTELNDRRLSPQGLHDSY